MNLDENISIPNKFLADFLKAEGNWAEFGMKKELIQIERMILTYVFQFRIYMRKPS